jgi:hypothetical protein
MSEPKLYYYCPHCGRKIRGMLFQGPEEAIPISIDELKENPGGNSEDFWGMCLALDPDDNSICEKGAFAPSEIIKSTTDYKTPEDFNRDYEFTKEILG